VRTIFGWFVRLVTAGALAVDAYVHADLVDRYEPNRSGGLSQGALFQLEAAAAAVAALLILLSARRWVWAIACAVAASALGAVLVYANYDIGAIGPIPDMYEPLWYGEKQLAAVVEAIATAASLLGLALATTHPATSVRSLRTPLNHADRHRVALSARRHEPRQQ
jgi:hypothetical protein